MLSQMHPYRIKSLITAQMDIPFTALQCLIKLSWSDLSSVLVLKDLTLKEQF